MRIALLFGLAGSLWAQAVPAPAPVPKAFLADVDELVAQAQLMAQDALAHFPLLAQEGLSGAQAQAAARAAERVAEVKARVDARSRTFSFSSSSSGRGEDGLYRAAGRELDERQYEKALDNYNRVIEAKGSHIEGALYWKAYALSRLGRGDQAAAPLDELKRGYPNSRWLNDARALELEIRQNAGQKPSPEAESDEDLKLLAMSGLIGTDPERVLPQIDKILVSAKSSPKLKERALFVLAQSRNVKARETLTKYAKGGTNPDLHRTMTYIGFTAPPLLSSSIATEPTLIREGLYAKS